MNLYRIMANAYDLLDVMYFSKSTTSPREVIKGLIPNKQLRVLDLCCGTLSNSLLLAKEKPALQVMGLDLSLPMLKEARRKITAKSLPNVHLRHGDATNTTLPSHSIDYIILGLVLHESSPALITGILTEVKRLLRPGGHLIVLEWEQPSCLTKRIKFAPLNLFERMYCSNFSTFYNEDKTVFFADYGFHTAQVSHCNYSIVLDLVPMN